MRWNLLAATVLAAALGTGSPAWAMQNCSGSVGTSSTPLLSSPAQWHVEVTNPAQNANSICVNPIGAAACGQAGSVTIAPGGDKWWDFPDLPTAPQIVASGAATPYQCDYQ